ncbi:MAG: J domain-containing protein [Cyanobacteria bacterium P01_D01_bin.36]
MQNFRDYYEILGIPKTSTAEEIKRAYRGLARQYHPDVNPGDKAAEEKFKLLGEAYGVLSDVDKRKQYEQYSEYWQQKNGAKGWRPQWPSGSSAKNADYSAFEDFDNFVEQLLKEHQGDSRAVSRRKAKDSVGGTDRNSRRSGGRDRATASRPKNSESRTQSRQQSATSTAARETARETTRETVRETSREPSGDATPKPSYRRQPPSPSRRDAEADLTVPLEKAYAGGRERVRLEDGRSLEVNMPPGMVTGQRIRLKGQGIDGGNLYLRIEVEPHSYFSLAEGNVYCRLPLTPSEAVLGGTLAMPTLGGPVNMMVPPGVQSGQRLKLTGKGYPIAQGLYGDQIVEIEVVMPAVLDDEEKALYQELRSIERFNPRAELPFP